MLCHIDTDKVRQYVPSTAAVDSETFKHSALALFSIFDKSSAISSHNFERCSRFRRRAKDESI